MLLTMPPVEELLGGYFIGLVFEAILLGVITAQAITYFSKFPEDGRGTKNLVCIIDVLTYYKVHITNADFSGLNSDVGSPTIHIRAV